MNLLFCRKGATAEPGIALTVDRDELFASVDRARVKMRKSVIPLGSIVVGLEDMPSLTAKDGQGGTPLGLYVSMTDFELMVQEGDGDLTRYVLPLPVGRVRGR